MIMVDDPIVAEIRHHREELMKEANYDIHTLCELLRNRQYESNARIVDRSGG